MKKLHHIVILMLLVGIAHCDSSNISLEKIKDIKYNFNNIDKIYISPHRWDWVVLDKNKDSESYSVVVNRKSYGPFTVTDLENSSPFHKESKCWYFRGRKTDGKAYLYVYGKEYGPFQEVLTPNVSADGRSWGAIIKQNDTYSILSDGEILGAYNYIFVNTNFKDLEGQREFYEMAFPTEAPYYYGKNRWMAFAYKEPGEYYVLSDSGISDPYSQIDRFEYDPADTDFPIGMGLMYDVYQTPQENAVAVGVSRKEAGATNHYLYLDGELFGPYNQRLEWSFFKASKQMSWNGDNWIIPGTDRAYTRNQEFLHDNPVSLNMNYAGDDFTFSYRDVNDYYRFVSGQVSGPYKRVSTPDFIEGPDKWVGSYTTLAGETYLETGSGKTFGPYVVTYPHARYNTWFALVNEGTGGLDLLDEGKKIAGPFDAVAQSLYQKDKDKNSDWALTGRKDNTYTVVINGNVMGEYGPFDVATPRKPSISPDGKHWGLYGKFEEKFHFLSNGVRSKPITSPATLRYWKHSEDFDVNFFIAFNNGFERYAVFPDKHYGPFQRIYPAQYSNISADWAFTARNAESKQTVISNTGVSEYFDMVQSLTFLSGEDVRYYIATSGEAVSLDVNEEKFGPYQKAAINTDDTTIRFAATENGVLSLYEVKY